MHPPSTKIYTLSLHDALPILNTEYWILAAMLKPWQKDADFLADVAETRGNTQHLRLWWLGQSGFLLQLQGRHLLLDPYLSDSLTRKYASTSKPHVRMTERVVAPEQLDFIDVTTSSHNHTDHLDP